MLYQKNLTCSVLGKPTECLVIFSFTEESPETEWEPRAFDELEIVSVARIEDGAWVHGTMLDSEWDELLDNLWKLRKI
jgi:hypothetical protein